VAISSLLASSKGFRSAQDLHAELRSQGDLVGLATVYRHLQSLADAGRVDVLRTADGEALYRLCSSQHHHHLVCRVCGRTVEVAGPEVEEWADRVSRQAGFLDVEHTLEVVGTCATCGRRRGGRPRPG
jgi:Fur family transcriptional regulator, ferric uptake regulator